MSKIIYPDNFAREELGLPILQNNNLYLLENTINELFINTAVLKIDNQIYYYNNPLDLINDFKYCIQTNFPNFKSSITIFHDIIKMNKYEYTDIYNNDLSNQIIDDYINQVYLSKTDKYLTFYTSYIDHYSKSKIIIISICTIAYNTGTPLNIRSKKISGKGKILHNIIINLTGKKNKCYPISNQDFSYPDYNYGYMKDVILYKPKWEQ